ncbi:hypothetical protein DV738_g2873, partial [Chaetothyriales sp. CBS 135597]
MGLPILHVADEVAYYGIDDPYSRSNRYSQDHYVCLWEVTEAEIIGHWKWDVLVRNQNWYEDVIMPAFTDRRRLDSQAVEPDNLSNLVHRLSLEVTGRNPSPANSNPVGPSKTSDELDTDDEVQEVNPADINRSTQPDARSDSDDEVQEVDPADIYHSAQRDARSNTDEVQEVNAAHNIPVGNAAHNRFGLLCHNTELSQALKNGKPKLGTDVNTTVEANANSQAPRDALHDAAFLPEHDAVVRRSLALHDRLQKERPVAIRKMSSDPGEKFYWDYWLFAGDIGGETNQTLLPSLERAFLYHADLDGGSALLPRWLQPRGRSLLSKRDYQCPTDTSLQIRAWEMLAAALMGKHAETASQAAGAITPLARVEDAAYRAMNA